MTYLNILSRVIRLLEICHEDMLTEYQGHMLCPGSKLVPTEWWLVEKGTVVSPSLQQ